MLHEKNSVQSKAIANIDSKGRFNLGHQFEYQYLTPRELDILKCLLLGYSAKEAGIKLNISPRTFQSYLQSIKLKLRCNKKSEIIATCVQLGLLKFCD